VFVVEDKVGTGDFSITEGKEAGEGNRMPSLSLNRPPEMECEIIIIPQRLGAWAYSKNPAGSENLI
jgi:hypothetical protein